MDPDATLNELEGPGWADPDYPSPMVQRIRALGQIPLREFAAEDYRLIITQQRALATLVPLALELLEAEPFAEGDLYAGDLLAAVANVRVEFWEAQPDLRTRAKRALAAAISRLDELEDSDRQLLEPQVRSGYDRF
jgi:hypothetical protein